MADDYQSIFDAGAQEAPQAAATVPRAYQSIFDVGAQEAAGPETASAPDTGLTSYPKALASGLIGGLAQTFAASGQAEAPMSGIEPETVPGPAESKKLLEQNVTGELPEYTSGPQAYVQRAGEFLGNPSTYLAPNPLMGAATGVTSALGSEAARQATEAITDSKGLQAAAQLIGGVIGGHAPNLIGKAMAGYALRNGATVENLEDGASNLYERSYNSGVQVKPEVVADWGRDIIDDLRKDGFRPTVSGPALNAFDTVGELGNLKNSNNLGNFGIAEIDSIRKSLSQVSKSPDATARAIARYATSKIDENLSNLAKNPDWLATGQENAAQVSKDITAARALYAGKMRSDMLVDAYGSALDNAKLRAASTGKGGNFENTMRQEIKNIAKSRVRRMGFSDDEVEALRDVAMGKGNTNTLRAIGALSPTGIVSGTLGLELGHLLLGKPGMLAAPVVGTAARWMGQRATRQAIEDVAARTRIRATGLPQPQPFVPARGYRGPLIGSALDTYQGQARGGAIHSALRAAKKR